MATESYKAVYDAVSTTCSAVNSGLVLPGGGATEMFLAAELRKYAIGVPSKKQLGVVAFADALESIPRALSDNAGMDTMLTLMQLRERHSKGSHNTGLNSITRRITDTMKEGIVEPLLTKKLILKGANETARTVIESDDIIYGDVLQHRIDEELKQLGESAATE